jgi:hypothetical protein
MPKATSTTPIDGEISRHTWTSVNHRLDLVDIVRWRNYPATKILFSSLIRTSPSEPPSNNNIHPKIETWDPLDQQSEPKSTYNLKINRLRIEKHLISPIGLDFRLIAITVDVLSRSIRYSMGIRGYIWLKRTFAFALALAPMIVRFQKYVSE